jgi:uncharacterized membrane protein
MTMETIALVGVVATLALTISFWPALPDRMPHHFDLSGRPDAWSQKVTMLVLPLISAVLYLSLSVLSRSPHHFTYPWPITPENARAQYRWARQLVVNLKVVVVCAFGWILWGTIQTGLGNRAGLGALFLPVVLVSTFGVVGFYLLKSHGSR